LTSPRDARDDVFMKGVAWLWACAAGTMLVGCGALAGASLVSRERPAPPAVADAGTPNGDVAEDTLWAEAHAGSPVCGLDPWPRPTELFRCCPVEGGMPAYLCPSENTCSPLGTCGAPDAAVEKAPKSRSK
jgi:hypothetical protein